MFWILIIPFFVNYTVSEAGYDSFIRLQVKIKCTTPTGPLIYLVSFPGKQCVVKKFGKFPKH